MASRIVPTNIDGTFPVAGQDNPSQGFRDNFTNIKNNFTFARNEISDLQEKVLLKSALDGTTLSNDLNGTQLVHPQLKAWTQAIVDLGAIDGSVNISFASGNFQKLTTAGSIGIVLTSWPTDALDYGLVRLWVVVTDVTHTLTLPSSVSIGENDIAGFNPETRTIKFDDVGNYVFDFSSIDSGVSFLIFDVTRNRSTFRDPSLYFNSAVNPTFLINYTQDSFQTALALEQGQDIVSVRGSMNSVAVGDLSTANVITQSYDDGVNSTQSMAGLSVTAARGNIWQGQIDCVQSSDYLGYVNSYAYNGDNNGGCAFMAMGAINFFASGADADAGLGGNVAIFTAADGQGELSNARLLQAIGFENDQSTHLHGNLFVSNAYVPTSSTSAGEAGQISFDSNSVYICLGPNNWKKATLTSF